MPKVSVVIPTYNRKEKLLRLLDSLGRSNYKDFEVIIVDDASVDGSENAVKEKYPDIKYLRHDRELLVGKSRNDGIMESSTNLVFMIDDDNVIDENTIRGLVDSSEKVPDFGVIAPVTCYFDEPDRIMYAGSKFSRFTRKTIFQHTNEQKESLQGKIFETDGFANSFMIRRDLAIDVGLTSPKIPVAGEDGFLQLKIKRAGYKLICVGDSYVYHDAPKTKMFMRASPFRLYYFMRGKITFNRELERGITLLSFSLTIPLYFLWYFFTSLKGENKKACMRAVIEGLFDGLFKKYPLRYY